MNTEAFIVQIIVIVLCAAVAFYISKSVFDEDYMITTILMLMMIIFSSIVALIDEIVAGLCSLALLILLYMQIKKKDDESEWMQNQSLFHKAYLSILDNIKARSVLFHRCFVSYKDFIEYQSKLIEYFRNLNQKTKSNFKTIAESRALLNCEYCDQRFKCADFVDYLLEMKNLILAIKNAGGE